MQLGLQRVQPVGGRFEAVGQLPDSVRQCFLGSLDPLKVPAIALQYTDEQIDARQVTMIVDQLVRRDPRYREVVANKVFQKLSA